MVVMIAGLMTGPGSGVRTVDARGEEDDREDCRQSELCLRCGCSYEAGKCTPAPVEFCNETWPTDTTSITCYDGRGFDQPEMVLSPLACLTALESLSLVSGEIEFILPLNVVDLTPLAGSTSLKWLQLGHTEVSDVSPLANLGQLKVLSLHASPVEDISPLSGLTQLKELDLSCTEVTDLRPLATLVNLEQLDLTSTEVSDLSPLTGLTNLEWLGLSEQGSVSEEERESLQRALPDLRITEGRRY